MKLNPYRPFSSAAGAQGVVRPSGPTGVARNRTAREPAGGSGARGPDGMGDTVDVSAIADPSLPAETRQAIMELLSEMDRLRGEADALRTRVRELEGLADTDPLAPVLNRRAFMRELGRIISFAQRYAMEPGLVFVDLDDFKAVNDSYGHAVGDAALKHVALILLGNVRESDAVGRLGGDEFAVVLAAGGYDAAAAKAVRLQDTLAATPLILEAGRALTIKATAGAVRIEPGEDAQVALSRADADMYARKRARRAR